MIGELDRRIDLYGYTVLQSATGEPVRTWSKYRSCWAIVEASGGGETIIADTPTETRDMFFTIRFSSLVTVKDRIEYSGVNYNITNIEEIDRRRYLKLTASKPDNE